MTTDPAPPPPPSPPPSPAPAAAPPPATGQRALVRALLDLVTLAATPAAEPAPAERLAAAGTEALGADAAVVLVVDDAGRPTLWTGSDEYARSLGAVETAAGGGPALDCCRSGRPLVVRLEAGGNGRDDPDPDGPAAGWPGWVRAAAGRGWARVDAVPLRIADRTVGALLLLRAPGRAGADDDRLRAALLAAAAASAIIQHRALGDLQRRAEQLNGALTSRVVIEQAKGMLAERGGLDVGAAFDRLRRYARTHRMRLTDVAQDVVTGTAADAVLTHVRPLKGPPSILEP